jgi:putative FmdB family regulatory protein
MPTYDYRCRKCGHRFELFHGITDETRRRCPRCRGRAERVPAGGAGLLFKGSGFYITDYRSASYREKARGEKAERASGAGPSAAGHSGEGTAGGSKPAPGKSGSGGPGGGKKSTGGERKRSSDG